MGLPGIIPQNAADCYDIKCGNCVFEDIDCPSFVTSIEDKEDKHMEKEEIDDTITEAAEMINLAYEHLLHELFTLGDYTYDLKIEYQDVDGKTITMSWQDRDHRIGWLQGE